MPGRIILFELNEVPFKILDDFGRRHPTSTIGQHVPRCTQFTTQSVDRGHLSPWRTWPSVHRGIPDYSHMITDFGQELHDVDREYPPLWQILVQHRIPTAVCGSLHTHPLPANVEDYAFYLPDVFAAGPECFPRSLEVFQDFHLRMVRESARNVSSKVAWLPALRLLNSAVQLRFRPRTFMDVGKQLLAERLHPHRSVRRRNIQAQLAFDVFMGQLKRTRPAFATFFTNHVAAAMHRFWAATYPEDYEEFHYGTTWVSQYRHEIDHALWCFDSMLRRLIRYVHEQPDYKIWIATSMGQAATTAHPLETQLYLVDCRRFMATMGLAVRDWQQQPAMLPQANFRVTPAAENTFRRQLNHLAIDQVPVAYREANGGFFSIDFGHENLHLRASLATLAGCPMPYEALGLQLVKIEDKSGASAYHVPQGCLLIYDPKSHSSQASRRESIPHVAIAPTILREFLRSAPSYMDTAEHLV